MIRETMIGATFAIALATTSGALAAGEVGVVQFTQAGKALTAHSVAGESNLFAAYFEPPDYAYTDRVQFNVEVLYNMNGAPYADGVAVEYPQGTDLAVVGSGVNWVLPAIWYTPHTQTPLELKFDPQYGAKYVIAFDRAAVELGVHVVADVSGDGHMDIVDAMLVAQASAGLVTLTQVQKAVADVNCDNQLDIADALRIAQASAGVPGATVGCQ